MTCASRTDSSPASQSLLWCKQGKLSMQLEWFNLPERSWASLCLCNHISVSMEITPIPFYTLITPAQPLLSLSCKSTHGVWRIWGASPGCFLMVDLFFSNATLFSLFHFCLSAFNLSSGLGATAGWGSVLLVTETQLFLFLSPCCARGFICVWLFVSGHWIRLLKERFGR